jgi:hypothetical protein
MHKSRVPVQYGMNTSNQPLEHKQAAQLWYQYYQNLSTAKNNNNNNGKQHIQIYLKASPQTRNPWNF